MLISVAVTVGVFRCDFWDIFYMIIPFKIPSPGDTHCFLQWHHLVESFWFIAVFPTLNHFYSVTSASVFLLLLSPVSSFTTWMNMANFVLHTWQFKLHSFYFNNSPLKQWVSVLLAQKLPCSHSLPFTFSVKWRKTKYMHFWTTFSPQLIFHLHM